MDDLLGLSWDSKSSGIGSASANGDAKPKPPPPPVAKPAHLQMGLSKQGLVPTPVASTSTPSSIRSNIPSQSSVTSSKPADDVFGSLMSSFGQNSTSSATKGLSSMTLEERRRHDQQQQLLSSLSSSPRNNNNTPSPSFGFSTPPTSTFTPIQPTSVRSGGFNSTANNTQGFRGYDPGNLSGSRQSTNSIPFSSQSSQSSLPALSMPKLHQPQPKGGSSGLPQSQNSTGFLASSGSLGRSVSPSVPSMMPLQPQRSTNASPAGAPSGLESSDPFGSLLGDQVLRSNSSAKNQSLNAIRNNTPPVNQPAAGTSADPWDLDFLTASSASKANAESQSASKSSKDVFDLGAFEQAPPEKPARSKRDSTDALSSFINKPSSASKSPSPKQSPALSETGVTKTPRTPGSPASVREDGDVAQIVAMGFSAERAKMALAMTETGRDIEAAIEYLVQNDEAESQIHSKGPRTQTTTRERRLADDRWPPRDEDDPPLEDRRRRAQERMQTQQQGSARSLQQQKDKIVGTASVFGMSVLSKANEIYKQGREKMQAVMDDMSAEDPPAGGVRRHQWVDDRDRPKDAYRDSDSEDEVFTGRKQPQSPPRQTTRPQSSNRSQPSPANSFKDDTATARRKEKEMFENTYISSARRRDSPSSPPLSRKEPLFSTNDSSNIKSGLASKPAPAATAQRARTPSPLPPKPVRPPRTLVQASSQQMAECNHHKEKGNEAFKLGQFGQAAELYARASQVLPRGHHLLIVTQNNRAAALLKTGEYRETITECERSIQWIQGPDGEGANDVLPESAGVNLKDQHGKALMRRATAYESLEKYKEAREDWSKLREVDPGHRNAAEGIRRCDKAIQMVNGGGNLGSNGSMNSPRPQTRINTVSTRAGATSSPLQDIMSSHQQSHQSAKAKAEIDRSAGVSKLRQSAVQQEREDDEKLRLSEQVDLKIKMWRSGKEDNIRALIASLGGVLWESAGWKMVGMHELVTPAQVKIKYMRAIGKVHPDKLNANTTVEQRMLANSIFSTLNTAWDSFKAQNNI